MHARPDGGLLVVGTLPAATRFELHQLRVARLTATGELDVNGRGGADAVVERTVRLGATLVIAVPDASGSARPSSPSHRAPRSR